MAEGKTKGAAMKDQKVEGYSLEQRILAAAGHFGILLMYFGVCIPALVWSLQHKKSAFISFQALQALLYQILFVPVYFIFYFIGISGMILFGAIGGVISSRTGGGEGFMFIGMLLFFVFFFGGLALYALLGFIGGIVCLFGVNFKYPLLGHLIDGYLRRNTSPVGDGETL